MATSYQRSRVQLGCWAETAHGAELLAAEFERAVDAFSGTWGTVPVSLALIELTVDDYRPDVGRYRRVVDVLVHWTEA